MSPYSWWKRKCCAHSFGKPRVRIARHYMRYIPGACVHCGEPQKDNWRARVLAQELYVVNNKVLPGELVPFKGALRGLHTLGQAT